MKIKHLSLLIVLGVTALCDWWIDPGVAAEPFHSWVIEHPKYRSLLSNEPPGLRSQGGLIWQHLLDVPVGRATGVRWGIRFVSEEMYRLHGELGFKLIASGPNRTDDLEMARKHKLQTVPECPRQKPLPNGDRLHILHPDSIKYYFEGVTEFLDHPDANLMWGIFAGDEDDDVAVYRSAMLKRKPAGHTYIHEFDRQVRDQFGGGKWGIPAGIKNLDPNPYRWIALYRYVAASLRDRQRRLYELVKGRNKKLVVTSFDSPGGVYPTEWSLLAPYADLFTLQMGYPGGSTRWRATAGFHCKVGSDLTGKDFWPCTHFEHYNYPHSRPEEVLEEISQIFRNGGTGIHIYLPDTLNISKAKGDLRTSYFSSPRRFHTVMNIARFIRTMPRLKLPDYSKTAILHNDDTIASRPHDNPDIYGQATETCYTFLGPVATSWFKFIDSAQVLKWPKLHDRYDVIYLPAARYQRKQITARLRQFVEDGGTLVCGDPEAFETDLLGNDTSALRTAIFGVTLGDRSRAKAIRVRKLGWTGELPIHSPAFTLKPGPGVEVLATLDDGTPAITSHKLGRGRAVLFGANVLLTRNVADQQWREFFRAFVKSMGTPTGFDIWNFKLPESLIWHEPRQAGVCLTNNRIVWREELPLFHQNVRTGGTYSYSTPPDTLPENLKADAIPFSAGRLTDRRRAIHAEKESARPYVGFKLPESHWVASWSNPRPVAVTFDLKQPRVLTQVKLWYRDTLADMTFEGSRDGKTWKPLGKARGHRGHPGDVYDKVVDLPRGPSSRYLRIHFAGRQPREKLTLAEVELWAAESSKAKRSSGARRGSDPAG